MRLRLIRAVFRVLACVLPAALAAQSPTAPAPSARPPAAPAASADGTPDGVVLAYQRFADIFGGRLLAALDSIPAARYGYRPTPAQQTVGYIAQHLEDANYSLCERFGAVKYRRTAKDSLADTLKARWPKDTLVARLRASLGFCDDAMARMPRPLTAAVTGNLLAFETDLAEHYSQVATYMRLLGLVPPSALPPRKRTAVALPASTLPPYAGAYRIAPGFELEVTVRDTALFVRATTGGAAVRLWPEGGERFFVREADAQVTFTRGVVGAVTGLVLHQFGRDRPARRIR